MRDAFHAILFAALKPPYCCLPGSMSSTEGCRVAREALKTFRHSPGFTRNGIGYKHSKRLPG